MIIKYGIGLITSAFLFFLVFGSDYTNRGTETKYYQMALEELKIGVETPVFSSTVGPRHEGSEIGQIAINHDFLECLKQGEITSARITSDRKIVLNVVGSDLIIQLDLYNKKIVSAIVWREESPNLLKSITRVKLDCDFSGVGIMQKIYDLPVDWINRGYSS